MNQSRALQLRCVGSSELLDSGRRGRGGDSLTPVSSTGQALTHSLVGDLGKSDLHPTPKPRITLTLALSHQGRGDRIRSPISPESIARRSLGWERGSDAKRDAEKNLRLGKATHNCSGKGGSRTAPTTRSIRTERGCPDGRPRPVGVRTRWIAVPPHPHLLPPGEKGPDRRLFGDSERVLSFRAATAMSFRAQRGISSAGSEHQRPGIPRTGTPLNDWSTSHTHASNHPHPSPLPSRERGPDPISGPRWWESARASRGGSPARRRSP